MRSSSARGNGVYFHAGQMLPMSAFAMGILAPLLLERDHFVSPMLLHDFGYDGCASYQGSPDFSIRSQHLRKGNGRAGIAGKPIHFDNIARSDSILFAAGADHRVHGTSLQPKLSTPKLCFGPGRAL